MKTVPVERQVLEYLSYSKFLNSIFFGENFKHKDTSLFFSPKLKKMQKACGMHTVPHKRGGVVQIPKRGIILLSS